MGLLLFCLLFLFVIVVIIFVHVLLRRIYPQKCSECEARKQQDHWKEVASRGPPVKANEDEDIE